MYGLGQRQPAFSKKDQIINMAGFVAHTISASTTQQRHRQHVHK